MYFKTGCKNTLFFKTHFFLFFSKTADHAHAAHPVATFAAIPTNPHPKTTQNSLCTAFPKRFNIFH